MSYEQLRELYENKDSIQITMILDLIHKSNDEEERAFYTDLCNLVMKSRQKECIAEGRF